MCRWKTAWNVQTSRWKSTKINQYLVPNQELTDWKKYDKSVASLKRKLDRVSGTKVEIISIHESSCCGEKIPGAHQLEWDHAEEGKRWHEHANDCNVTSVLCAAFLKPKCGQQH